MHFEKIFIELSIFNIISVYIYKYNFQRFFFVNYITIRTYISFLVQIFETVVGHDPE